MNPLSGGMNWPNLLTLSRAAFGVGCLFTLTSKEQSLVLLGLGLMILAELTDFLDGFVARTTNSVTEIGKVLDPLADSLYRLMVFAAFVQNGWMAAWVLSIFIVRDVGVSYLRIMALQQGLSVASRFSGKAKAVAQAAAQIFVVCAFGFGLDDLKEFAIPALYAAAVVTLYSLFDYAAAMSKPRSALPTADRRPT